jgi:hypothetical protein
MFSRIGKLSVVLAAAVLALGATCARADGWSQEWVETNSVEAITQMQIVMQTPGVSFTSLSAPYTNEAESVPVVGWSAGTMYSLGGESASFIDGLPDSNDFYFTIGFSSAESVPLDFDFQMWSGSEFDATDSANCRWSGSQWSCSQIGAPVAPAPEVAEPADLALFGTGLLCIGLLLRNRIRS